MTLRARIRARLRDERGFTLVELLTVMGMVPLVLGSTLLAFNSFASTTTRNGTLNDAQRDTRVAVDRLARELRNLASPTPDQPQAIDKATAFDLVFQTVDPVGPNSGQNATNVRRQRYCLDGASGNASTTLWSQTQTWTTATAPAPPGTATCPDPAWGNQKQLAARIANRSGDRALFTYNNLTDLTAITSVGVALWSGRTSEPSHGILATDIFLRNQNRRPVASLTAVDTNHLHILLNGSASADPEGEELTYVWYDGAVRAGSGMLFDYAASVIGPHDITLHVFDPAGLEGVSSTTSVIVT